jgi:hypothetical protein
MVALIKSEIRIEWAREKLDQLELLIEWGIKDALQAPTSEPSDDGLKVLGDLVWRITPEARRLVSEYALHARAALDYIVYDLALHNKRSEQEGTQFPICECKKNFPKRPDGTGIGPLKHLTPEQIALIERFQPYNGFPLLHVLHGLSNRDKHRHFAHIAATSITLPVLTPDANSVPSNAKMNVKFYRSFEITLEGRSDAAKTLRQLHTHLTAILNEFNALNGT